MAERGIRWDIDTIAHMPYYAHRDQSGLDREDYAIAYKVFDTAPTTSEEYRKQEKQNSNKRKEDATRLGEGG